ncbi:MAG TPA: carboxypeptidase-like regulatory domain-containing protein [Actinomycetota bacterium]|jgi:hypothetical protein|nr:carboxypeptidase-like regulatory domain-containing protein [Actinomycetota bacterium]
MNRGRIALVLLVPVLTAACSSSPTQSGTGTTPTTGIRGVVLLGPVCPIVSAESPCPPRPLADTTVEVRNDRGQVVATAVTDARGRFGVQVPPGRYQVRAEPDGAGPRIGHLVSVTVPEGGSAQVKVPVDSGIR